MITETQNECCSKQTRTKRKHAQKENIELKKSRCHNNYKWHTELEINRK